MNEAIKEPEKVNIPEYNLYTGKVLLEKSILGVPNLIVEANLLDKQKLVQRFGSVHTDDSGKFLIKIPRIKKKSSGKSTIQQRFGLIILAPERIDLNEEQRILFQSELRDFSNRNEYFHIELSKKALKDVGIEISSSDNMATKLAIEAIAETQLQTEQLQVAVDEVFQPNYTAVAERRELFRTDILDSLKEKLSTVSEKEKISDRYVAAADEIEFKQFNAVATDINTLTEKIEVPDSGETISKYQLKGRMLLTDEQKNILTEGNDQITTLTEAEIEKRLEISLDKPATIYQRHLEPDPCRPRVLAELCLDDVDVDSSGGDEGGSGNSDQMDNNGNQAGGNIMFDGNTAVANLMHRQTSPEDPLEFGVEDIDLEPPLTVGGVSDVINKVIFTPGPADVPAFYDFHDLQIAFEPIWQEALDDKYIEDVEKTYDQFVERGGAPAYAIIKDHYNKKAKLFGVDLLDGFFDNLFDIATTVDSEVPPDVISAVYISLEEWRVLPQKSRTYLLKLATRISNIREEIITTLDPENITTDLSFIESLSDLISSVQTPKTIALRTQIKLLTSDAERLVAHARRLILERKENEQFKASHEIIEELRHKLLQAYPFRHFAASKKYKSVNFGMMTTYRQKWSPVSYQAGELVSTIPLAPKEIRKFSKKTIIKTKRARKEIESNLISRKSESEDRSRAESEIVARATASTTVTFSRNAEKHSQSIKKEFREAILKSAEEYKNERKVEVTSEESYEEEITESGEIQNPNDEIPVTFLFYELQRRFKVSEKIHRLQSVVLIAQEVPTPRAIDNAWLIQYDWILNRALLDDSFRAALTYLSTTLVSEDAALKENRHALFRQRKLVEEIKEDVSDRRALAGLRYAALQRQIERTAESADSGGGFLGGLGDLVSSIPIAGDIIQGGLDLFSPDGPSEEAQIREGAARDAFDRERREEQELASRLQNSLSSLEAMERNYSERLAAHLRQVTQCERLKLHIKQNIMYYMQVIWSYEPDDQRYLRLRNVPVPIFEKNKNKRQYKINPIAKTAFIDIPIRETNIHNFDVMVDFGIKDPPDDPQQLETKPLSEVADLNRPLGFMGNYMLFPMFESNPLTEFMMDPYVTLAEGEYGLSDPDTLGNMTLDEFSEYVCCLKKHFEEQNGDDVPTEGDDPFEELKPYLRDTLKKLLELSLRQNEEVIVPTDNLFIEALPGAHSIMERFKHLHRQIDVKQAQSDLRKSEIDNIRRANRILADDLEDPEIESKYVFEGGGSATIVPPA